MSSPVETYRMQQPSLGLISAHSRWSNFTQLIDSEYKQKLYVSSGVCKEIRYISLDYIDTSVSIMSITDLESIEILIISIYQFR